MSSDHIQAKIAAQKSYTSLLELALQCASLYDKASLEYPDELKSLFGIVKQEAAPNGHRPEKAKIFPQMLPRPDLVPQGMNDEWVSIPVKKAIATSLVLAYLRADGGAVPVRTILNYVSGILPEVGGGTIANIGTRLSNAGIIARGGIGWSLIKSEAAGLVLGDRYWAPVEIMEKQELAAHRREAILHTLPTFKSGLQLVQIVERLKEFPWVKAPVNKDLLKDDMQILLKEGKVRHRGNTKKWEVVPSREEREEIEFRFAAP
jgi:hypothetical protein